ncbi:hypothetical protein FJZ19_01875 [Candidatus Pacearchaeota archaeon]|nr:hypothetical protein [Candidatus Pacearchaeota archaeon]
MKKQIFSETMTNFGIVSLIEFIEAQEGVEKVWEGGGDNYSTLHYFHKQNVTAQSVRYGVPYYLGTKVLFHVFLYGTEKGIREVEPIVLRGIQKKETGKLETFVP